MEDITIKQMLYVFCCAYVIIITVGIIIRKKKIVEKHKQAVDRFTDKSLKVGAMGLMIVIGFYFVATIIEFLWVMIMGPFPPYH